MSRMKTMVVAAAICMASIPAQAQDVSGRLGLTGIAQAGFAAGQSSVRRQADDVGSLFGAMLRYGVSKHWSAGVSYENFDAGNGVRVEPLLLNGIYHLSPEKKWSPSVLLGLGASRGVDVKNFNHIAAKAGVGLDYFLHPDFSVGPQVSYHYVSETDDSVRHLHAFGVGIGATLFFNSAWCTGDVKPAAPAAAVPAPSLALALQPATATLTPGQSQQFNAKVSGASNKEVNWSLSPSLGSISNTGLYTAPASIALAEKVTVTATSAADGSKSASSLVYLNPPANAAQQVNIELKVLFDTSKDVVKPEYRAEIQQVADFMKNYPSSRAEIEGHTDNMGDDAMNQQLSQRRADAVLRYLVQEFSVGANRLTARGYGETKPLADNATAEGRAKNRRVVATLSASK